MRRLAAVAGLVGALALGGAAPLVIPALASGRGATVEAARWCRGGVCLSGVSAPGVRVREATVGWRGEVRLVGVEVEVSAMVGGGGEGGGGWTDHLRPIDVEDLRVAGTPLPSLSGRLRPERHLIGEGVEIVGDIVTAAVDTEWGPATARYRRDTGEVEVRCEGCVLRHDALGPRPLPLDVGLVGTFAEGRFRGKVSVGEVHAVVSATWTEGVAEGTVALPSTPIADVYAVLAPIVPEAARARIGGTVSGEGAFRWPEGPWRFTPAVDGFTVDGLVGDELRFGPFTRAARDAAGEPVLRRIGEGTSGWTPLPRLGRWLPAAVIAAEDAGFRAHPGYDLAGMLAAAEANEEAGEIVRGGSTLTQQLAKNLWLDGERNYTRKLRELLYAVEMERELGKTRILELYLNVVEWAPGVYGAHEGARAWFFKSPEGLLPEEAAFLAGILRQPRTAWRNQYLRGRPETGRVAWVLGNMGLDEPTRGAALGRGVHLVPLP